MAMVEFHFDSTSTSPFVSAPSSPGGAVSKPFAFCHYYYTSAPATPSRETPSSSYFIPFDWESKPGTPKHQEVAADDFSGTSKERDEDDDMAVDFAFEFSGQQHLTSTADELFEAGKIRPLKLPPRLQQVSSTTTSPKSPSSPISRLLRRAKGREEEHDFDPFAKAIEETIRGRDRDRSLSGSIRGSRRAVRSLSPLRAIFDCTTQHSTSDRTKKCSNSAGGSKKWRLKDLLLFRSASEGRATGNRRTKDDVLNKYTPLTSTQDSSGSSRRTRRRDQCVSEAKTRIRTFLPYRSGLLGCLGLNQSVHGHGQAFGFVFGSLARRRT